MHKWHHHYQHFAFWSYKKNIYYVALVLFISRSQMKSKCDETISAIFLFFGHHLWSIAKQPQGNMESIFWIFFFLLFFIAWKATCLQCELESQRFKENCFLQCRWNMVSLSIITDLIVFCMQTNMLSSDLTGSWDCAVSFMKATTVNELKFNILYLKCCKASGWNFSQKIQTPWTCLWLWLES